MALKFINNNSNDDIEKEISFTQKLKTYFWRGGN